MRPSMTRRLKAWDCSSLAKCDPWNRFWRIHRYRRSATALYPVVPAQITTMPPVSHMKIAVGMVSSPGCSNTIRGERFSPAASQKALPNAFAPSNHVPKASVSVQCGSMPQWSNPLRSIVPTAPSLRQKSALSADDTTATAFAPWDAATWIAMEPRPPAPPHQDEVAVANRVRRPAHEHAVRRHADQRRGRRLLPRELGGLGQALMGLDLREL